MLPRVPRRLFLLAAGAMLLALPSRAQPSAAVRYWITVDATVPAPPPSDRALARRAARGTGHPADRVLAPSARDALAALGVVPVVESRWLGAVSAPLTEAQRAAVAALPFVRGLRPVAPVATAEGPAAAPWAPLTQLPAPPDAGPSLGQLQHVGADVLLDAGYTGAGVRLGFLDTLFDFAHPALAHVGADGRLVAVRDFTGGQTQDNYHGLNTSSIAMGYDPGHLVGPAWGATVVAATTEFAPTETRAEEDFFVAGLEWLEAQGVDVVSISLGYSLFDAGEGDYAYADMDGDTTPFTRAADRAASLGVVVVTSAGNEGAGPWRYITAPADGDSVIAVGAATPTGARASFSSVGPTADGRIKPDVAAQGTEVVVAVPGGTYRTGSGTSFSAPMVAGVAAQLLQARPSLTPMEVREVLRSTARQASAPTNELGWGVINAVAALNMALSTGRPPDAAWRLYPSVARSGEALVVETPAPDALTLYDALGRRVGRFSVALAGRSVVPIPRLAPGLYLVRRDGAAAVQRFIVVR